MRGKGVWRRLLLALALLGVIGAAAYPAARHIRATYHLHRAEQALAADELDEAGVHLAECLETWPDNGQVHFLAARAARRSELYNDAAEHLQASQKALGRTNEILLEWSLLHFQRGAMSPALESHLHSLLAGNPPEAEIILEAMAQGYMRTYCLKQALSCLDEWVRQRPEAVGARLRRGWVHERLDQLAEAEADYGAVLANHPGHPVAQRRLAELLLLLHRGKEAEPHFRSLLARQPSDPALRVDLARCLVETGQTEEAQALLDEVLARQPDNAEALLQRGILAREAGQTEAAEAWLRRAAELQPLVYAPQFQLLQCLQRAGKKEEARALAPRVEALAKDLEEMNRLTALLQARPDDPDVRYRIAQVFLRNGEEREGRLWLEGILQTHPHHAPTRQALTERKTPGPGAADAGERRSSGR